MSKHTPGPWKFGAGRVFKDETEDRLRLDWRSFVGNKDDNKANARLIATAPRMLEALKAVIKSVNQDETLDLTLHEAALIEVLNSIRQAEGRPEIKTMLEAEGL